MKSARDEIFGRIDEALGVDMPGPSSDQDSAGGSPARSDTSPDTRGGRDLPPQGGDDVLRLLQGRIQDYRADVIRCGREDLPRAIAERLRVRQTEILVIPADIPDTWLGEMGGTGTLKGPGWPEAQEGPGRTGTEVKKDGDPDTLSNSQLDAAHGVLTGCALAIAETGTLVLDGGSTQGRRALSLVPDYHLCVVFMRQVVRTVPDAVNALKASLSQGPRPLTFISGPSATSDIELIRVEGVHGPRTLDVILVEDS